MARTRALRTRALVAVLALSAAAPAPAAAPGDGPGLFLDQDLYAPGELATVTLTGTPGHVPVLLIATYPGPTDLPGVGELAVSLVPFPTLVVLPPFPASGERQVDCAFDCESPILRQPCFLQTVTVDPGTSQPSGISNLAVLSIASGDCGECPEAAELEPYCGSGTYHAITLPGIGQDFVFVTGASFVEQPNGTGSLSGVVARLSDPDERFFVDIDFAGRIDPGAAPYPPDGSPKRELCDEAYVENGGTIHPGLWHYYETLEGQLVGLGDFAGALLRVDRMGPPLQVGFGANGKNLEYGASSWLYVTILAQPDAGSFPNPPTVGDINIGLDGECVDCPEAAIADTEYGVSGQHALWIPGVGTDFVLADDARFTESRDGTARLVGTAVRAGDPDVRFEVDVLFAERVDPGSADHPPAGSPKLELDGDAYVDGGGLADPDTWRYYRVTDGFLVGAGAGDVDGAVYSVQRLGPAFQVGLAANGKNVAFGASGWLDLELLSPAFGPSLPATAQGDFNLDLGECPD